MRLKFIGLAVAAMFLSAISPANSTAVEIHFSGGFTLCYTCGGDGTSVPYTGVISFETDDPSSGFYQGPNILVRLSVFSFGFEDDGYVSWGGDDLNAAVVGFSYYHLAVGMFTSSYVQYGTCPTHCGSLTLDAPDANPLPVPGPLTGAGYPAIIVLIAALVWRRPRPSRAIPT